MRLLLIRHGETEYNKARRIQGQKQTELSEKGLEQSILLGERLKGEKIHAIYSSALVRASRTAAEIAKHHSGLMLVLAPELNERSYGVLEGLTFDEIKTKHPHIWPYVLPEKLDITIKPEGGESDGDIAARAMPFIHSLAKRHRNDTVAVVTHGDVIRVIMGELLGMGSEERHDIPLGNVCINELHVNGEKASIVRMNDVGHIDRKSQKLS